MRWLDGIADGPEFKQGQELVMDREAWRPWDCKEVDLTE